MNKAVITAVGVASPLGTGYAEFMASLQQGKRGIDHIQNFETSFFPVNFGAEVREDGEVIRTESSIDRKARFIHAAMDELFRQPAIHRYDQHDRRLYLGTGIDYFDFPGYVNSQGEPHWSTFSMRANQVVNQLAATYAITGGHLANVAACVASTQALGLSLRALRVEDGISIISGGFDSMLSHLHYMGFYNLGALSNWQADPGGACRPFDKRR